MSRKWEISELIASQDYADRNDRIADHDLTDYAGIAADLNPNDCGDCELPTGYYTREGDWVSFDIDDLTSLADYPDSIGCDDCDVPF